MNALRRVRCAAAAVVVASIPGCGLIGPSCLERQQRGPVTTLQGTVAAGAVAPHLVPYEPSGSQNDAQVGWDGRSSTDPPRLRFYATRSGCTDFKAPPAASNDAACAIIASAGWTEVGIASTLIVTHGRGNPERLGSPPEYKIWVVGDAERSVGYTITITWFYGPDC